MGKTKLAGLVISIKKYNTTEYMAIFSILTVEKDCKIGILKEIGKYKPTANGLILYPIY